MSGRLVLLNRLSSGCLTGAMAFNAFAMLPAYHRLTPQQYLRAHALISWYADLVMPVLGVASAWTGFERFHRERRTVSLLGTLAYVGVAGVTCAVNFPINLKTQGWLGGPPTEDDDILDLRDRWAVAHLVRTTLGLLGFVAFLKE